MFRAQRVTSHRDDDDLLTAGLGIDGLRAFIAPAFADIHMPTAIESRRRAIWNNWRGIADLRVEGGYGKIYGSTANVPGREFSAFATIPGARHPHRVLVQVPDAFDHARRCVLVAPSSGSRGVYGAIAVAGAWGLPKGCAIAYTDKGTGTDYFDLDAGMGVRADGTVAKVAVDDLAFVPDMPLNSTGVSFKHAHSRDNPEADWGRHVRQAAEYALISLDQAFPAQAPFTFENTRIIAVGLSNGGGAVLRAAEQDDDWLDAVVAAEPSVLVEGCGARALYDYATEAMLWMPAALQAIKGEADPSAREALARLRASGWTDEALRAGTASVGLDLWRAIAVTYSSAYGRYGVNEHPCGYGFAMSSMDGHARAAVTRERATWWCDASGIPPGTGIDIIEVDTQGTSAAARLQTLRDLWSDTSFDAERVRMGVAETRAGLPRAGLPVTVIHGVDDGLIPMAFTSSPYITSAHAAGRDVRFWQLHNVQHFDALLAFPEYGTRYLPILPYIYAALDQTQAWLDGRGELPQNAIIHSVPGNDHALAVEQLMLPGQAVA